MADTASSSAPQPVVAKAKKASAAKAKKPKSKPSHPPTSDMVNAAIKNLKERGGSSLQAIKKYIASTYKVDTEKLAPFIKKYLKGAVAAGKLVQTKGKGASGSFRLSATSSVEKKAKKVTKLKAPSKKSGSPSKAKKTKKAKVPKVKSPSKVKRAKSPKKPKAKKAPRKSKSPKKSAPKKK